MGIFKSLYRWKSKVKSIAFLSSREHSRMNSSNLESLQRTMTYRTTLERQITQMISSRQLMMPMRANPLCLTKLGGGQDGDLIMAFFPCIHFCGISQTWFDMRCKDYKNWDSKRITDYVVQKNRDRAYFYEILVKFCGLCLSRNIRMIFENPIMGQTMLRVFLKPPTIVDNNRMTRGDYMIKPTGYWFWNCEPTYGFFTEQNDKFRLEPMKMKKGKEAGICSEERSLISPDYASIFICYFILGRPQPEICPTLFDAM